MSGAARPADAARPTVAGSTRVRLHPLRCRTDGESVIVGRVETGDFISVPPVGNRTVELLAGGATVDEVRTRLRAETGSDVNVAGFVSSLTELGFVAEIDGRALAQPPVPPPMFPRIRPHHVRWLLHPAVALAVAVTVLAAVVAIARDASLFPSYRDLLWSGSGGAVIIGNAVIGWTLLLLHELAHLFTARAAGAPGRMSLSTRLQFLVAQTDVSGVWAAPRRERLTVYLSGVALNLAVFGVAVLVLAVMAPQGPVRGLIAAVALISLTMVPVQFLVFMRTDVYFVLQDVSGCANLYAEGSAYARFCARRALRWPRRSAGAVTGDPSRRLPRSERRAVRAYTVVLVSGTAACLAVAVLVTLPFAVSVLAAAGHTFLVGGSAAELFDAAAVVATVGLLVVLWTVAWWRRHGHRVRRWWAAHISTRKGGEPAW
jgi:putative peptide zinc metalloprotease protein